MLHLCCTLLCECARDESFGSVEIIKAEGVTKIVNRLRCQHRSSVQLAATQKLCYSGLSFDHSTSPPATTCSLRHHGQRPYLPTVCGPLPRFDTGLTGLQATSCKPSTSSLTRSLVPSHQSQTPQINVQSTCASCLQAATLNMASPKPFTIDIPQSALEDLKRRLQNTRLPDNIPGADWDMGTEPSYLQVQFCSTCALALWHAWRISLICGMRHARSLHLEVEVPGVGCVPHARHAICVLQSNCPPCFCCALQDLLQYWIESYDWRAQEAILNKTLNHYSLHVNTINLHFVHQRSPSPNAIPLILIHGWPGSILEFTELIPKLVNPGKDAQTY